MLSKDRPLWEHFYHGADIGIRGIGRSLEEAFELAAVALTAVITDPEKVLSRSEVSVRSQAPDTELLLVDWLNSLIYEMATRKMLFGKFQVEFNGTALLGRAYGELVDLDRHEPAVEVKGATYTELKVKRTDQGFWIAQCVADV